MNRKAALAGTVPKALFETLTFAFSGEG